MEAHSCQWCQHTQHTAYLFFWFIYIQYFKNPIMRGFNERSEVVKSREVVQWRHWTVCSLCSFSLWCLWAYHSSRQLYVQKEICWRYCFYWICTTLSDLSWLLQRTCRLNVLSLLWLMMYTKWLLDRSLQPPLHQRCQQYMTSDTNWKACPFCWHAPAIVLWPAPALTAFVVLFLIYEQQLLQAAKCYAGFRMHSIWKMQVPSHLAGHETQDKITNGDVRLCSSAWSPLRGDDQYLWHMVTCGHGHRNQYPAVYKPYCSFMP